MKVQLWLTDIERDLISSALEFLRAELVRCQGVSERPFRAAGSFTERRIAELAAKVCEPERPGVTR